MGKKNLSTKERKGKASPEKGDYNDKQYPFLAAESYSLLEIWL